MNNQELLDFVREHGRAPGDGGRKTQVEVGCLSEQNSWDLIEDHAITDPYDSPGNCPHARMVGTVVSRTLQRKTQVFVVPRVIMATNECGNNTRVCLDCVLDFAKTQGWLGKKS